MIDGLFSLYWPAADDQGFLHARPTVGHPVGCAGETVMIA
jgi:hypothetical protein